MKREINDDIRTYIKNELDRILPKSYKRFSHICDFLIINFSLNFKLGKNLLIKMYVSVDLFTDFFFLLNDLNCYFLLI
jgi:hypothetical protein